MPINLLKIAEREGIVIDYWDFKPPLQAVYWTEPGIPPIIGLSWTLLNNRPLFRCILAEELGHHFTTVGDAIPKTYYNYSDRLMVSRAEYRALKWAALYLMPLNKLVQAFKEGIVERWELAEYFDVTEQMVDFRLKLPDLAAIQWAC
ncbi:MAG: hypothetical protein PWR22_836 [Moorella sp. (in: firmicutes)]|nr:hypothetical protein [Moorella sp. (in: firmicutes)]